MPGRLAIAAASLLITAAVSVASAGVAAAHPPTPPGETVAREHLAALTVTAEGPMDGYEREKFPHWSWQSGNCDTREVVLRRDGAHVTTGSDCYPTSGRWYSIYDQQWVDDPSNVHLDHAVALAEAWRSGASQWNTSRRQHFANDLTTQQLIAVSGESNLHKSDQDASEWVPSNEGYHCMYARSVVNVKYHWGLSVDRAERTALSRLLDTC